MLLGKRLAYWYFTPALLGLGFTDIILRRDVAFFLGHADNHAITVKIDAAVLWIEPISSFIDHLQDALLSSPKADMDGKLGLTPVLSRNFGQDLLEGLGVNGERGRLKPFSLHLRPAGQIHA